MTSIVVAARVAFTPVFIVGVVGGTLVSTAHAAEPLPGTVTMESCAAITVAAQRLACYDGIAGRATPTAPATPPAGLQTTPSGGLVVSPAGAGTTPTSPNANSSTSTGAGSVAGNGMVLAEPEEDSLMSSFWELDDKDKRGTFNFMSYRPNYVLPLHYTSGINRTPNSPSPNRLGSLPDYRKVELKMQISLRTKVAQGLILPNADLWFAYSQQSLWQVYDKQLSSPFRSTDYQPEAIYVISVPKSLRQLPLGWQFRMVQAGIVHQSDGQSLPYSRSWNRVYLGGGFEHSDLALTVHVEKRLKENADTDDNPDIVYYKGHGDVGLTWTPGKATASLLWRTSFKDTARGSWQFDWTYPVDSSKPKGLRWYAQVFSGYGETLLDYNYRQTSVGAGVSLFEF